MDVKQKENNLKCKAALLRLTTPLLSTWPCFTEAMYLAYRGGGWPTQKLLWRFVQSKVLEILPLSELDQERMQTLMEQYRDVPMDLTDATLVAVAEARSLSKIFTLDSDFQVYRINGKRSFEVIP